MADHPPVLSRPPRLPGALPRPRLEAVGDVPGVLLVGPAGSGKTVLAARLAAQTERIVWARLAPGYAEAADLLAIAATSAGADVATANVSLLDMAGDLLAMLETAPTTLVVDDYHLARGEDCDPLVAEVLPLLPPESRVVLCSRVRPAGLLGRVPAGLLRVMGSNDLAFTEDEAVGLFAQRANEPSDAAVARDRLGGWAAGLALAAEAGATGDAAVDRLVHQVLLDEATAEERAAATALVVLPYVDADVAAAVAVDLDALASLAARTMLVVEESGHWRLHDLARDALAGAVDAGSLRPRAAPVLERADPAAAVDLLIADGDTNGAAEVLGRHLSSVPADRAVQWLYQLPAELRRRFPPALAAGRATVDLDAAVAQAQSRLDAATDDDARREALFALGSAHAHAGALASAATALESAVVAGAAPALAERAGAWLGIVRWWAGDLVGAEAALAGAGNSALAHWARAEVALAGGRLEDATRHAEQSRAAAVGASDLTEAPGAAVLARVALAGNDTATAERQAEHAYRMATEADGIDLAAAAPVWAAVLVARGQHDEALAVADLVNRRVGRHDAYAKLHVHLVRAAVAAVRDDADGARRAETAAHAIRQHGFALVEAQARSLLAPLATAPGPALRVDVLGPSRVEVGGEVLPLKAWKSHKALEVLHHLALAGDKGAHREEVIEAVWPDRDPEKGRMLLRAALSEIRRRLEPGRQAGEASQFLHTAGDRLRVEAATDLADARRLAQEGSAVEALAQFRGDLLEDSPYLEWAFDERRAAEHLRAELAERVAGDEGAPVAARAAGFEVLLAAEPWREELYDRLAALHRSAGDEAAARAVERRRDEGG